MKYGILIVVFLVGCSPITNKDKADDSVKIQNTCTNTKLCQAQSGMQDITDYSPCSLPQPTNYDIFRRWKFKLQYADSHTEELQYQISRLNTLTMTNTCAFNKDSVAPYVDTSITSDSQKIILLNTSTASNTTTTSTNYKFNCVASVVPMTFQYSFKGLCLVLTSQDSSQSSVTLVPVN